MVDVRGERRDMTTEDKNLTGNTCKGHHSSCLKPMSSQHTPEDCANSKSGYFALAVWKYTLALAGHKVQ